MLKKFLLVVLLLSSAACANNVPPNLSPNAVVAYQGTKVILSLDVLRDAAIALAATNPPVIRQDIATKVVQWHKIAITTIHDTPSGWKVTVITGLDSVKSGLNAQEQKQLGPYFALAKTLINEVAK